MNRVASVALGAAGLVLLAGSATAQVVPDDVVVVERIFNDFPDSTLVINEDFPNLVTFDETNFGMGNFANRHSAYFSTDGGATSHDFDYADAFDFAFDLSNTSDPAAGREAGFHADLFGLGFFGPLPHNGEIAAFGSIFPFHSFGTGLWTPGAPISLRIIHTPGEGNGVDPLPMGAMASTIEYIYDLGAGPVTSGAIPFTNNEGGIPQNFTFLLGFGVQNQGNPGGTAHAEFSNFVVPAPGALALLALGGLAGFRRRR